MIAVQLAIQAAHRPDDIAVVYGQRRLSYAELHARSARMAQALAAQGVRPGDRVAALLHNCPHFFEALFGCAMLGAIYVPINFRLVRAEVAQVMESCAPAFLLAGESFADLLDGLRDRSAYPRHVRWIDDQPPESAVPADHAYERWLSAYQPDEPAAAPAADAPLILMHSSGTTGLPKGIIFSHATALASSAAKTIDFRLAPDDITVVFGPLFHAGPLMDLALPLLLRGGRVVLGASRQFDPQRLMAAIAEHRGTVIPIYPTMLRRLLATPIDTTLDLSSLRLIITGGEAAPVTVIHGTVERFPNAEFINNYGSTEGGPVTTFLPAKDSLRKAGSVGRESYSVQVRIVDKDGRWLGPGEVGELVVRSPFVCCGYFRRPTETVAQRRNGWWYTGDLAWRDDEGDLWIAGRSKDMVKSGTENVYPIEVEQVIVTLEGVVEVGVIGVPDEEWGESVVAYVVAAPGSSLDAQRVIDHCREHLASYKKPRHVRFIDNLPRGTTNKVAKNVLRELWAHEGAPPSGG
jgi:fatty-acyl-CoA synthase